MALLWGGDARELSEPSWKECITGADRATLLIVPIDIFKEKQRVVFTRKHASSPLSFAFPHRLPQDNHSPADSICNTTLYLSSMRPRIISRTIISLLSIPLLGVLRVAYTQRRNQAAARESHSLISRC